MNKVVVFLLVLIFAVSANSYGISSLPKENQVVKPMDDIKSMFANEQYQEIIDQYAGMPRNLSAEELTYVAQSYTRLDDLANAFKYAEMSVKKDPKLAQGYYVQGVINSMQGEYVEAANNIQKAITLAPKQAEYQAQLGDIYYEQSDYTKALSCYNQAIKLPNPSEKAFYMVGATYAAQEDSKNALDAFYVAKKKIVNDKELYVTVLYNIAKMEFDNKEYIKASEAYKELTEYFPDDFYSQEKLIECFNSSGYYTKAKDPKSKLYAAYENGKIATTGMSDRFCIGHFAIAKKEVSGYERFEKPVCRSAVKYIFYIANSDGVIESEVYIEYIPAAEDVAMGNYEPVLMKDNQRYTFNIIFEEDVQYSTLESFVKEVITRKVEPVASKK